MESRHVPFADHVMWDSVLRASLAPQLEALRTRIGLMNVLRELGRYQEALDFNTRAIAYGRQEGSDRLHRRIDAAR